MPRPVDTDAVRLSLLAATRIADGNRKSQVALAFSLVRRNLAVPRGETESVALNAQFLACGPKQAAPRCLQPGALRHRPAPSISRAFRGRG